MNDQKLKQYPILMQQDYRKYALETRGHELWTVVYKSWCKDKNNGGELAAFSPPSSRGDLLKDCIWEIQAGDGAPGFSQFYEKGKKKTKYHRYPNLNYGIEPIIYTQNHYQIKPSMLPQITDEFRLFHNLWMAPDFKSAFKINSDGTEELVAKISEDYVEIRTKLLRQYQAARQLDLVLFSDSIASLIVPGGIANFKETHEGMSSENCCCSLGVGKLSREEYFSRFIAKKIIPPPLVHDSKIWPYDAEDEQYIEFIIGEDASGSLIKHSCNPKILSNAFGANPEAPSFLTPVFFKRHVLQRYYEEPEKFTVNDGHLRCGSLWGLRLDNDHPEHVMVFLGDLGQSLPESERGIWKSFNILPVGKMSETVFRRSFLGQPAEPQSPDLIFKATYLDFCQKWKSTMHWHLFTPLHESDEHNFYRLRIPLIDSQPEFEAQISSLTKLLIDYLNEDQLTKELESKIKDEKGISKFERWLTVRQYPDTHNLIAYLRRLQLLRSKISAHKKGSSYKQFLIEAAVNESTIREVSDQLTLGKAMLESLGSFFFKS